MVSRGWGRRMEGWIEHREVRAQRISGSENTFYDAITMDTCHYTFIQNHSLYNMRSESSCKLCNSGDNDVSVPVHQL